MCATSCQVHSGVSKRQPHPRGSERGPLLWHERRCGSGYTFIHVRTGPGPVFTRLRRLQVAYDRLAPEAGPRSDWPLAIAILIEFGLIPIHEEIQNVLHFKHT